MQVGDPGKTLRERNRTRTIPEDYSQSIETIPSTLTTRSIFFPVLMETCPQGVRYTEGTGVPLTDPGASRICQ